MDRNELADLHIEASIGRVESDMNILSAQMGRTARERDNNRIAGLATQVEQKRAELVELFAAARAEIGTD